MDVSAEGATAHGAETAVSPRATAAFLLRCARAPDRFFYPCNAKAREPRDCSYRLLRAGGAGPVTVFVAECAYGEGGTGWRVWPCALLLSCWLAANHAALPLAGSRAIELGCGLGLPALTAASLGAGDVRITDCLPKLLRTVRRSAARAARPHLVAAALLDWDQVAAPDEAEVYSTEQGVKAAQRKEAGPGGGGGEDACGVAPLPAGDRFDLLLASDVVYSLSHARQLPAVLERAAAPSRALACLMVPVRSEAHTRRFLDELAAVGFRVRLARVSARWVEAVVAVQLEREGEGEGEGGWSECAAASGRPFYHHRASGRSVWHRPAEMDYAALLARAQPDTRADEVYRADTRLTEGEILFVEAARGEPPLVPADTG